MNCIVIDDDMLKSRLIEEYLQKTDGLFYAGSFSSAYEALQKNATFEQIDIIFLDVEMPGMNGFDFLRGLENPPAVVMMSSKGTYAVEAFSFSVTDFLLKPILYNRFLNACEKAEVSIHAKRAVIQKICEDSLFLKKHSALDKINYKDIVYIEAMENYAVFHTETVNYIVNQSMKYIESKLPMKLFRRIHRSYIANVSMVYKIDESFMILGNENQSKALPIGNKFKSGIMKAINTF